MRRNLIVRLGVRRRLFAAVLMSAGLVAACSSHSSPSWVIPQGSILSFTQGSFNAEATQVAGVNPVPEKVCGSDAGFLTELATVSDLAKAKVQYEWAPVIPGTAVPGRPTIREPTFAVAGKLVDWVPPMSDLKFDHPFGLDYSMDIAMAPVGLSQLNLDAQRELPMHAEIESGLFPYDDLGWGAPKAGDSVALKGDWIVDCGHPGTPPHVSSKLGEEGYGAEIHPPTFLAFARATRETTDSIAIVNPYRPTQLYNGANPGLANDFDNEARFTDSATGTFPESFKGEVSDDTPNIGIHELVQPTDMGVITWTVCAPNPKPSGATLIYSYNFTARTGIRVQVIPKPAAGCIDVQAAENAEYTPAPQRRIDDRWPWDDISKAVNVIDPSTGKPYDVRAAVAKRIDDACNDAHLVGYACIARYKPENDPYVDKYKPLHTRQGAASLGPADRIITEGADDQPFPMYGRVRVAWS